MESLEKDLMADHECCSSETLNFLDLFVTNHFILNDSISKGVFGRQYGVCFLVGSFGCDPSLRSSLEVVSTERAD